MPLNTRLVVAATLVALFGAVVHAEAQGSMDAARELYASADYDRALGVLDSLAVTEVSRPERQSIELYRALSLLGLGRKDDAEREIAKIIAEDPLYRPRVDVPPRVRTVISDTRRRLLPSLVQQNYAKAKTAFDRQDFAAAAAGFQSVVDALADPDIAQAASQAPLSDLRVLAGGFRDLSAKAAAPPPAPAPVAVALPPPVADVPHVARIYSADDSNVVPPVTIQQSIPPFRGTVTSDRSGAMEVVVDQNGLVESAAMVVPMQMQFDRAAIAATRSWRYEPARVNGEPVKFRKRVQLTIIRSQ